MSSTPSDRPAVESTNKEGAAQSTTEGDNRSGIPGPSENSHAWREEGYRGEDMCPLVIISGCITTRLKLMVTHVLDATPVPNFNAFDA